MLNIPDFKWKSCAVLRSESLVQRYSLKGICTVQIHNIQSQRCVNVKSREGCEDLCVTCEKPT